MESTTVIRKPLVTEKSTFASSEFNRYSFEVDARATKPQIKKAVEDLYEVRVLSVSTQNRKGQLRKNKFGQWRKSTRVRLLAKIASHRHSSWWWRDLCQESNPS